MAYDLIEDLRTQLCDPINLPTLRAIVPDILAVADNPRTGIKDIERIVEKDQSCVLKILNLANSAYYGFSRQISSIKEAILVIGFDGVKHAALSVGMTECFNTTHVTHKKMLDGLWAHSMATATAASALARRSGGVAESFAYFAGLVHDFGKVILTSHFGPRYAEIFFQSKEEGIPISLLEQSELGIDHETVAGWVVESWNLPDEIQAVVANHHRGFAIDRPNDPIAAVALADVLAYASGVGDGGNGRPPRIHPSLVPKFSLTEEAIGEIVSDLQSQADRFEVMHQIAA